MNRTHEPEQNQTGRGMNHAEALEATVNAASYHPGGHALPNIVLANGMLGPNIFVELFRAVDVLTTKDKKDREWFALANNSKNWLDATTSSTGWGEAVAKHYTDKAVRKAFAQSYAPLLGQLAKKGADQQKLAQALNDYLPKIGRAVSEQGMGVGLKASQSMKGATREVWPIIKSLNNAILSEAKNAGAISTRLMDKNLVKTTLNSLKDEAKVQKLISSVVRPSEVERFIPKSVAKVVGRAGVVLDGATIISRLYRFGTEDNLDQDTKYSYAEDIAISTTSLAGAALTTRAPQPLAKAAGIGLTLLSAAWGIWKADRDAASVPGAGGAGGSRSSAPISLMSPDI